MRRLFFVYLLLATEARRTFEQLHSDKSLLFPASNPVTADEMKDGSALLESKLEIAYTQDVFEDMDVDNAGTASSCFPAA